MKLTSNELLTIAHALAMRIQEIRWKESNLQRERLKDEISQDEYERLYAHYRRQEIELEKLREKVFDIEFGTRLEEVNKHSQN